MNKIRSKIALISIILSILAHGMLAQEMYRGNPADRDDPKTLLRNPAILPFQNLAVNFGMRILNYGFLEDDPAGLRFIYNTSSYPDLLGTGIALGVTAVSFNTPLYHQSEFGLATAYSIGDAISIGLNTRFRNHGFARENMDLVVEQDPMFSNGYNQWNISFDAGLLVNPNDELSVGVSLSNLNRPDLSFQDKGVQMPIEMAFGGKYYFRNFAISLFGNYFDERIAIGLVTEANINNRFLFRSGYLGVDKSILAETRLNLAKGFGLCYRFEYPLNEMNAFNSGTHQLELTWNMRYNPLYAYNIKASADTVLIYQEIPILRISYEAFSDTLLKVIDPEDLLFEPEKIEQQAKVSDDAGLPLDDLESDTSFYRSAVAFRDNFKDVKEYLDATGKRIKVIIKFDDAVTAERALILRKYFIDSLNIMPQDIVLNREDKEDPIDSTQSAKIDSIKNMLQLADQNLTDSNGFMQLIGDVYERMEPDTIYFKISDIRRQKVAKWRIVIVDFWGDKIHEILGYHRVKPIVRWDGFTSDGRLIRYGNFLYYFQYSLDGRRWVPKRPKKHRIFFRYIKRQRIVEIRKKEIDNFDLLKTIIVKLKNPQDLEKLLDQ